MIDDSTVSDFVSLDSLAENLTLAPSLKAQEGLYTIEIEVSLVDYQEIKV